MTGGALPIPARLMSKGFFAGSLLAMWSLADLAPAPFGAKLTAKVLLPLGPLKEPTGKLATENTPESAPSIVMATPVRSAVPRFLMVKVRWLLAPTTTRPKSTLARPLTRFVPAGCSTAILGTGRSWNAVCCSINPLLPLATPPVVRARARMTPLAGRFSPVSSQPPLIRVPAPSGVQVDPSVANSKLTCVVSGTAPPRCHSTRAAPGTSRVCGAASFTTRATKFRGKPPMAVKLPPARILPSACNAIPPTVLFALTRKPKSGVPFGWSRAKLVRTAPPTAVKVPPIKILPSACNARLAMPPLTLGSKLASKVPSGLSRAILLRFVPPTEAKYPPSRSLPSACTARM